MVPCSVVRPQHRRIGNNGERSRIFQAKRPSFGTGHRVFVHLQALSHITSSQVSTEALVSQSLCVLLPGVLLNPNKTYLPLLSLLLMYIKLSASCRCLLLAFVMTV